MRTAFRIDLPNGAFVMRIKLSEGSFMTDYKFPEGSNAEAMIQEGLNKLEERERSMDSIYKAMANLMKAVNDNMEPHDSDRFADCLFNAMRKGGIRRKQTEIEEAKQILQGLLEAMKFD